MARTKVTTDVLADDAVTTAKIADNAITSAKIGVDVIVAEDLAANSITVSEITDGAVTYAKIQDVSATDRVLGRDSSGSGVVEEISPASLRTMINVADGANAYVHPNHSGEVTSTADGATVIASNIVDEDNLKTSNTGSNGQFLQKSSGTGNLTWADAGGGWTDCTEGLVTSTAGQNNIDFSIPAGGVNQIRFMEWNTSQEANGERWVQLGDGSSIKTSGYLTTSTYAWTSGNMTLAETTNAIRHDGWSAVANIWFSVGNLFSIDNGRRWFYEWEAYSDPYGEYVITTRGHVDMGSGNVARTLRFATQAADGYDADGLFRVYYATMG